MCVSGISKQQIPRLGAFDFNATKSVVRPDFHSHISLVADGIFLFFTKMFRPNLLFLRTLNLRIALVLEMTICSWINNKFGVKFVFLFLILR